MNINVQWPTTGVSHFLNEKQCIKQITVLVLYCVDTATCVQVHVVCTDLCWYCYLCTGACSMYWSVSILLPVYRCMYKCKKYCKYFLGFWASSFTWTTVTWSTSSEWRWCAVAVQRRRHFGMLLNCLYVTYWCPRVLEFVERSLLHIGAFKCWNTSSASCYIMVPLVLEYVKHSVLHIGASGY